MLVTVVLALALQAAPAKPNFTGVWAGPGFTHKVGPNDTDTSSVRVYDSKNFSPFKPGGEALFKRKPTGDETRDDPTAFCLPKKAAQCSAWRVFPVFLAKHARGRVLQ